MTRPVELSLHEIQKTPEPLFHVEQWFWVGVKPVYSMTIQFKVTFCCLYVHPGKFRIRLDKFLTRLYFVTHQQSKCVIRCLGIIEFHFH
jgi:hypothetical protein